MTPQEFKEKYIDEDGEVFCEDGCNRVEEGESIVDYKHVFLTNIYMVGEEYFAVDFMWDNTGYWGDGGEGYEPTVRKVKPIIVKTNKWVNVENN